MDRLFQDLKIAIRTLARQRTFSLVAILTLALGVGATTAIFSVVYGILLRPLPYIESERLVTLGKKFNDPKATPHRKLAIRRQALQLVPKPEAVNKIFTEIAPRYADRKGGYMRVIKTGAHRLGDGSQKVLLAFVGGLTPAAAPEAAEGKAEAPRKPTVKPKKAE